MRIFLTFFFFINFDLIGQEIKIKGNFIEDSIQVGNVVSYNLKVTYPNNIEVLLPDSNYNYGPFEYIDKLYLSTVNDSIFNYDEATYKFTSFNLDSIQFLKLPVFIINSGDSLVMNSNTDSIFLMQFIGKLSDSLNVKSNTKFSFVNLAIDYPLITKLTSFLFLFLITFYLLFRKKIKRYFKIRITKKEYNRFINKIEKLNIEIAENYKLERIELFLLLWKRYNERVSKYPYSSLTTNELIHLGIVNDIKTNLNSFDNTIYGNKKMNDFNKNFIKLKDHSTKIFNNKLKEINNE